VTDIGDRGAGDAGRCHGPGGRSARLLVTALVAVAAALGLAIALGHGGDPGAGVGPTDRDGVTSNGSPILAAASADGTPLAARGATPGAAANPAPSVAVGPGHATSPAAGPGVEGVPLVVVSAFANYSQTSTTRPELAARLRAGTLVVPCGAEAEVARALGASAPGAAPCVPADRITARLDPANPQLALVPPALVTPRVRVIPLEGVDLFGERPARSMAYPLSVPAPATWPAAWSEWNSSDVQVVVTTGVNCPDRGVSHQTVILGRGWGWLLRGGTARYTGTHWDARFGWTVVDAVRTGHAGAVRDLIRNADVAVSDFECPMTRGFVQHESGTVFSIDPRVAPLMARAGFDVATVAADHTTNAGLGAVGETVDLLRANGIQPTGAGRTLAEALGPAVVDTGGIRFGFVGFDAIGGSASATSSSAGVAALTAANVRAAVAKARAAGAQVIIGLPQWSSVEYRAQFTQFQRDLVKTMVAAGVDDIVGADFHWAGALSITQAGSGYRYVGSSQGNFWFDQDWSRQTQEGIMTSLTFVGTRLAQVRLAPIVVLDHGQPNLLDPATDGQFVLRQVLAGTTLPSR
jgi:poly-gamma-glutamate capsule biosynthesis protein CapA/YwtB (metallophosphatase superfamily)